MESALDEARSIFLLEPTIKVLHGNHYDIYNDKHNDNDKGKDNNNDKKKDQNLRRTINEGMFQVRIYLEAGTHTISFLQPGDSIQLLGPGSGIRSKKKYKAIHY